MLVVKVIFPPYNKLLSSIDGRRLNAYNETSHDKPLNLAVRSGNIQLVRFLLDHGAVVGPCGYFDSTALHHAAIDGNANIVPFVRLLLERGANPSWDDANLVTPMYFAANRECVVALWLAGASDESALHAAVNCGLVDVMEECIVRGVDVDVVDNYGWSPLMAQLRGAIVGESRLNVVRCLTACGANVNAREPLSSQCYKYCSALNRASSMPEPDVARVLIVGG